MVDEIRTHTGPGDQPGAEESLELTNVDDVGDGADDSPTQRSPRRPWWRRALQGLAIAVFVLVVLGALLYNFGGMMPPSAKAKAQYGQLQALGAVAPVENRFHIPIPGCVCHSDNPVLQVEHSKRSLNQCMSCHGAGGEAAGR
jgi:hypothetical protein